MPRCSIIVPVYNRASLTRQCLTTLLAQPPESVDFEVIVVDDASSDMTQRLLTSYGDQIRVVTHTTNAGFATSCNDGASVASGKNLVFLNNDTIPKPGWLDTLLHYADSHPRAAAIGSKLLFPNNTIQHAGVVIGQDGNPRHLYAGFPSEHASVNKSRRFQIVTAACMLIKQQAFELVKGFDPAFRNGYEDVDLCLRLGERGYEVHYCHESVLCHLGSASREGRWKEDQHNLRLYRRRWAHRVQPDDLRYYIEDGLLRVHYQASHPLSFSISPLLAVVNRDEYERQSERLLNMRSRQVSELLKEIIRLTMYIQERALPQALGNQTDFCWRLPEVGEEKRGGQRETSDLRQSTDSTKTEDVDAVTTGFEAGLSREAELRVLLADAHDQLLRRDEEALASIYNLQTNLAAALQKNTHAGARGDGVDFEPSRHLAYQRLIHRIREVVSTSLPPEATVIVVTKGDSELLRLDSRRAWHFPQAEDGAFAGYHPANSDEAIAHLEALRVKGGDFLVFPNSAFWWLGYYVEFGQYLETRYRVVVREEDTCVIFALREPAAERR